MKSIIKKLPASQVELSATLDKDEFKEYWDEVLEEELAKVHLKGFRPGMAPREMAEHAVDKDKVFNEAANRAVRYALQDLSEKNHWTIIDKPQVEIDEKNLEFSFHGILTLFPEIKLGNYKKIAKKIFSEKIEVKVDLAEVDKALDWLRESRKKGDILPELNDEFSKSLGKFQNVAELRQNIEQGVRMEKEFHERDKQRVRVLDEIIKSSEIDVPNVMIEKTLDHIAKDNKELRDKMRDKAKHDVLANLILFKIAEIEKIDHDPKEGVDNFKVFELLENLSKN